MVGELDSTLRYGRGLRFPCNDRTDEVNKLFIIWPSIAILTCKKDTTKTREVTFYIRLRALLLSSLLILKKNLYASFSFSY